MTTPDGNIDESIETVRRQSMQMYTDTVSLDGGPSHGRNLAQTLSCRCMHADAILSPPYSLGRHPSYPSPQVVSSGGGFPSSRTGSGRSTSNPLFASIPQQRVLTSPASYQGQSHPQQYSSYSMHSPQELSGPAWEPYENQWTETALHGFLK